MPDYEICNECGHAVIETVYYACKCNDVEKCIAELETQLAEAHKILSHCVGESPHWDKERHRLLEESE